MVNRCFNYRRRFHTGNSWFNGVFKRCFASRRRNDKKHDSVGLLKLLRNEEGWSVIETLLVLPLIIFLIFAGVQYWGVLTVHQRAESLKYTTLDNMEIKGGLTPLQENVLAEKLTRLGADKDTIRISGDILGDGQKPVFWPDTVYLRIEFIPEHFDNFTARTLIGGNPLTNLKIAVEGSAISSHAKSEGNN